MLFSISKLCIHTLHLISQPHLVLDDIVGVLNHFSIRLAVDRRVGVGVVTEMG